MPGVPQLPPEIDSAITRLSRVRRLLVASDFDGTMAPIVEHPDDAVIVPGTRMALAALAALPATTVAVISGRSRAMLQRLAPLPATVHLVGSHGVEFDDAFGAGLHDDERARLADIDRRARAIAARFVGIEVERKPASIAIHYRHVCGPDRDHVLNEIYAGPCAVKGSHVTTGKMVVEVAALMTSKGLALERLRQQENATAVVFIGDDVTDEDAFERLGSPDIGVKVGEGPTAASLRIPGTDAVDAFLTQLAQARQDYFYCP